MGEEGSQEEVICTYDSLIISGHDFQRPFTAVPCSVAVFPKYKRTEFMDHHTSATKRAKSELRGATCMLNDVPTLLLEIDPLCAGLH